MAPKDRNKEANKPKAHKARSGLVRMSKPGEKDIEVNPLVVENHQALGWKVVQTAQAEQPEAEEPDTEEPNEATGGDA